MENTSEYFAIIGDSTRMQILHELSENKRMRAKDVLEHVSISQPTLSHHMSVLVSSDIVHVSKIGRECYYSINSKTIDILIHELKSLQSPAKKDEVKEVSSFPVEKKKKGKAKKDEKEKREKKKKKKEKK